MVVKTSVQNSLAACFMILMLCVGYSKAACGYSNCKSQALWTCSLHDCTTRTIIDLHSKNLWGTLPPALGSLHTLSYALELFDNQLTGTLPSSLGSLSLLNHYIGFGSNTISGTIPPSYGSLRQLAHHLSIHINRLTGSIPASLGSLQALDEGLSLSANQLTGTLPPSLRNLKTSKYVFFANNKLTGTVPSWFGSLSNMENVRLNDNKFTGTLPSALGSLTGTVSHFYMGDNMFTGTIPASLCPIISDIAGYCDLAGDLMFFDCPFPSACAEILASKCDAECDVERVDCVGAWGSWNDCSESCGGGESRRTFTVTTEPEHGGTPCPASNNERETRDCNTASCDIPVTTPTPDDSNEQLIIIASASAGGAVVVIVVIALVVMSCKKKQRPVGGRELKSVVSSSGRPSTYATSATGANRMTTM